MNNWNILSGTLLVEVTSAEPERTLNAILQAKISVYHVSQQAELTWCFTIHRKDRKRLESLIRQTGGDLVIRKRQGLYWQIRKLYHRPVLVVLAVLLLSSSVFLPTRILFVRTEGNQQIPAGQILSAAESCGIGFGASRKQVRSEKVKNALLAQLPQLQWAGINTSGCTAVISVRERTEETGEPEKPFSNLIATQDGYILSQVILKGTPMFTPGESVMKGQILVSGYTDCGICIRAGRAEGEILAQTARNLTAVMPKACGAVGEIKGRNCQISLLIRKKRINLWKNSRISDTVCGRMYEEYFVSLPGGFRLPIAICIDQYLEYETSESQIPEEAALEQLQSFSDRYLLQQTVAGQILKKQQRLLDQEGVYRLQSRYTCTEMIGREQEEQMGEINEQGN